MSVQSIQLELMLLDWSNTAKAGPKVVFALVDDGKLRPFQLATLKKGKLAGQRYMAVLVPLDDEEEMPDRPKGGDLSRLAGQWCNDDGFRHWLIRAHVEAHRAACEIVGLDKPGADIAAQTVRILCGIQSRAELDHDENAAELFHTLIRKPYREHLGEGNG